MPRGEEGSVHKKKARYAHPFSVSISKTVQPLAVIIPVVVSPLAAHDLRSFDVGKGSQYVQLLMLDGRSRRKQSREEDIEEKDLFFFWNSYGVVDLTEASRSEYQQVAFITSNSINAAWRRLWSAGQRADTLAITTVSLVPSRLTLLSLQFPFLGLHRVDHPRVNVAFYIQALEMVIKSCITGYSEETWCTT
ncbi:hypothetical protein ECG_00475 [Echinococcus granulosus]|uniref:RAB3GAP2_N domain-containing protein n=1 Tax=Echinococcus granulosus TaxID=6210 RepID=A0A068W9G9_ECHGR|nr:hypothetical protein ECG_00475 [Echinococcus granulosus]CDS16678.1 hypothetical protein EgrG_002021500 [Echinococcus granulosus]